MWEGAGLTWSDGLWSQVPEEHDGVLAPPRLRPSPPRNFSYRALASGGVVTVEDGELSRVWRRERGRNHQWGVKVTPTGSADVTVTVNATTDCAAAHAVCTADGGRLEAASQAVVPGPAALSAADARGREGEAATLDFVVSLSRARAQATTVDYATSDGTHAPARTTPALPARSPSRRARRRRRCRSFRSTTRTTRGRRR